MRLYKMKKSKKKKTEMENVQEIMEIDRLSHIVFIINHLKTKLKQQSIMQIVKTKPKTFFN